MSRLREWDLGDGMSVCTLGPIFATNAFRRTSINQNVVVNGEGGVGAETLVEVISGFAV